MKNKTRFLTLEFIINDNTYWLTSDCNSGDPICFTVIPLKLFDGFQLKTGKMFLPNVSDEEAICSSIRCFDNGEVEFQEKDEISDKKNIKLESFPTISWNEMAKLAMSAISLEEGEKFFHNQIIGKRPDCKFQLHDVDYRVTAFLPDQVFAIYGEDYSQDNPNWISFHVDGDRDYFNEVVSQFYVKAISLSGSFYRV